MALDTKSNAKMYHIVVKFTLKNVYYFEKKYGVGVERDTVQAHRAEAQWGPNLCEVAF